MTRYALLLVACLTPLTSLAEEEGGAAEESAESVEESSAETLERAPVLWSLGASSIVPFDNHGAVTSIDGVLSTQMTKWTRMGLRLSIGLSPIQAPQGPDTERAWGAILEVRQRMGLGTRVDPIGIVAGGFVVGDRDGESISNLVLPYAQLGVGLHLLMPSAGNASVFFIEPELGVIPGVIYDRGPLSVVAPYSAVRLGIVIP